MVSAFTIKKEAAEKRRGEDEITLQRKMEKRRVIDEEISRAKTHEQTAEILTQSDEKPLDKEFLLSSNQSKFEKLCSLDVQRLVDKEQATSDEQFREDFCKHLKQTEDYTTTLPWKLDQPVLPENRDLAEARLRTTTKRLEKLKKHHQMMLVCNVSSMRVALVYF